MSTKFDEQREDILSEIGELGGFDEAEKTASDEESDGEISTEELCEKLGEMAQEMPGEPGEVGDGTNMPNEESAPSGEGSKNDREADGVPSGESAKNEGEESGVPSGEDGFNENPDSAGEPTGNEEQANTPTQKAENVSGEDPNKNSETTDMKDVKDNDKQAEDMPPEMKEKQKDMEEDGEIDGDSSSDSENGSSEDGDSEGESEEGSDEDSEESDGEKKEALKKKSAREEIETDIIEGALSEALNEGLGEDSLERFTDKIASFQESTEKQASTDADGSDETENRFTSSL